MESFVDIKKKYDLLKVEKITIEQKKSLIEDQIKNLEKEIKDFGIDPSKIDQEIEIRKSNMDELSKKADSIISKLEEIDGNKS